MSNKLIKIIAIVIFVHLALWTLFNLPEDPGPDWQGLPKGVSFSPYRENQNPLLSLFPSHEEIRDSLRFLKGRVGSVRTYSSLDGMEIVPGVAATLAMPVTAGAWVDHRLERNEREISALIANTKRYKGTINRVIVGNEAILREDIPPEALIRYIERVRREVGVPVSTAEPWHVWMKHPELARHVDFISIHVLPYWERISARYSVSWVLDRYEQIQKAFPKMPIYIAEVGWPSGGERQGSAKASPKNAEIFLRQFLNMADRLGLDYCVVEAFDQPWKHKIEGIVGGYWGLFDLENNPKYRFEGPVQGSSDWIWLCALALMGLLPALLYLKYYPHHSESARLFFSLLIQATASVTVWILFMPITSHFLFVETLSWALLLPFQFGLLAVVLINGFELSEMVWSQGLKRRFVPLAPEPETELPLVSIHVPICKEPPEMVKETLNGLAALDYPNLEILVIDNNNPHPELWQPVEAHCSLLGSRFRFFHLETHPGFKAGALNFALSQTDPDARIVAVVDSDYVVRSDWLKSLVPYFQNPRVGVVQAPQDHREWEGSIFKTACNREYQGFFEIGMVHRNERNAIIQHGTMTLIRKSDLESLDGWAEWCICEDAELGLRILQKGQEAIYVKEGFGKGLTPDSFAAYKRQRSRWAYGAVQIMKRHGKTLLPWNREAKLTLGQRYHFVAGWLPWLADGISHIITWAWILWALGMLVAPTVIGPPISALILPVFGVFIFKLIHFFWLYRVRVKCGLLERLGAAVAGVALTHTIAKAVLRGIFTSNQPFLRTPKCEGRHAWLHALIMAREEAVMMLLLWLTAANLNIFYSEKDPETILWVVAVLVQCLPYAASVAHSLMSVVPTEAWRNLLHFAARLRFFGATAGLRSYRRKRVSPPRY